MTVMNLPVRSASAADGEPAGASPLSTQRTLARELVHRAALAEVFLTDFASHGEQAFSAAAQLPPAHLYYGDHTDPRAGHDPLAVFESVRQMLLCAMHLQHDAPSGSKSITATAGLEITDPAPLRGSGPLDLDLRGSVALSKEYRGTVSRVVHQVEVLVAGAPVGRITVDTAQRPDEVYQQLRMSHRESVPPSSDILSAHTGGRPVPARLVAREVAANVVLEEARIEADGVVARLRVPVAHPSMFDHAQDHVPGPVMMEAARQSSLLLAATHLGLAPERLRLSAMDAEYLRFAELDSPIAVLTRQVADEGSAPVATEVVFEQEGSAVARMRVRLSARELEVGDAI